MHDKKFLKSGSDAVKVLVCLAAVLSAGSMSLAPVSAEDTDSGKKDAEAEANRMPDIEDTYKSLTINFGKDADDGSRILFPGAEFSVYKVADLTVSGGSANYTLVDPFKSLAVIDENGVEHTFDGLTSDKSKALAKKLADKAEASASPIGKAVTNAKGAASFTINDCAMYLAIETNKTDKAAEYETADPFLISVPEPDPETHQWVYKVEAKPKTEVKAIAQATKKPAEKKQRVSTGVQNTIKPYVITAAVSGVICFILGVILVKTCHRTGYSGK